MPNYEIKYKSSDSVVLNANNEEDAQYQFELDFSDYPDLEIIEVKELIE